MDEIMRTSPRHLIHESLFSLELEREDEAPRYQEELSRLVHQRLLPIFDKVCAGTDPNTVYRIDTLELDLGELNPGQWEKQLTERVQAQFSLKLREAVQQLQQSGVPEKQTVSTPLELLRFFLRTATLPWWADIHNPNMLKDSVEQLLSQHQAALLDLLRQTVRQETQLHRLIYQLPDQVLVRLAACVSGGSIHPDGMNFPNISALSAATGGTGSISVSTLRREVWKGIFYGLLTSPGLQGDTTQWATFLELYLQQRFKTVPQPLIRELSRAVVHELFPAGAKQGVNEEQSNLLFPVGKMVAENLPPTNQAIKEVPPAALQRGDEFHLSNAGLILLWPFLARFFENLGLVKHKAFSDERAPHRAIALLQFLADGNTEPPEYLLPLNKVLCGLRPDALYEPPDEALSEDEQQAALQFLEAVISNAPILHNMSVDGFRNTFLRRTGILSMEDDHWLLHVERETYDVVLERFPWSYQIVKLPWMERPMYVDW